jgi:hypothetical protein
MILLAKVGVGFLGAVAVGGAALCSEGFIHVKVHEKQAGGTHLSLIVPAAAVPMALQFVPDKHLAQASQDLRPYLPMLDAAIPALEECPDGVLVEVVDSEDHVVITKAGGSLVVDVNDPGETVHLAVPLAAAQSSLHQIASASGPL